MKRQLDSSLFERFLLSKGDINKEQVLSLAAKGVDYTSTADIIKDPYVLQMPNKEQLIAQVEDVINKWNNV